MHRKYVIPFILACVILACNAVDRRELDHRQYSATIFIQAGLSDVEAHWGYVILTTVNFLVTMVGVMLVDRKGRKFLLSLGTAGIIASLVCGGWCSSTRKRPASIARTPWRRMAEDYQDINVTFDISARVVPRQRDYAYPARKCRHQGVGRREDGFARTRSGHRRGQDRQE